MAQNEQMWGTAFSVPAKAKPTKSKPYGFKGKPPVGSVPASSVETPAPTAPSAPAATGQSAAEKAAAEKKRKDAARKKAAAKRKAAAEAAAEAKANQYNPLMTPFLSPAEIRQQAEELANLSVPSEAYVQQQGEKQIAGIGGLTSALQGRLAGVNTQGAATIAGMGQLYKDIAAQAQGAGTSAAAAAGAGGAGVAAPVAAGGNPMVAANLANLAAQTSGLVPAAGVVGAGLESQARSALTKALIDRATSVSADTAKYIKQLQDYEYQKATGQQTLQQNAALLGLKEKTLASDIAYKQGSLAAKEAANNIRIMSINRQIAADQLKYGAQSRKPLDSAKQSILADPQGLVAPVKKATGLNEYVVTVKELGQTKQVKAYGVDPASAAASVGAAAGSPTMLVGPQYVDAPPSYQDQLGVLTKMLVNAGKGMITAKQARKWVVANVPILNTLPRS